MKIFRVLVTIMLVFIIRAAVDAQQAGLTHRVALVDVAYIFKNYKKFDAMTASLREAVEQAEIASQCQLEQMRAIQEQLSSGTLTPGSPEQARLETKLIEMQTQLQARRVVDQRDFQKKEADIYKTAYLEVEDAVRTYARHYKYTLVLQFTRPDLSSAASPREILDQLNTPVIFYSEQDDVTEPILKHLNDRWSERQSGQATATPASGTRPGPAK